uniref:Uncharacterized protein n=1 Tax=Lotharella oceanica TaxID=641309 RepID=A0A7S2TNQ0_9EUKA
MQVAPTSEFALPIYASMVPLNTTIPRRGLTTIPMSIQDDHPHIQTWEGLSSDFVPSLNVYAVTIGNRIPVDKNDVIAFVEQFGASSYGASIQTPVMYKSLHVSINSDSIENYDDTDTMTLYESDLGGSPCQMYPWTLFKCSPVITSVTVMPMVIKDYQMNPLPCTMLEASAEKNKVKVSNMQACMDEADENEFRIEEWHIFLTYGMFAVERLA